MAAPRSRVSVPCAGPECSRFCRLPPPSKPRGLSLTCPRRHGSGARCFIPNRITGRAYLPAVVSQNLELRVPTVRGPYGIHVVLRREQMREHAVCVPLSDPRIGRVCPKTGRLVTRGRDIEHGIETHQSQVLRARAGGRDHMIAAEGEIPGSRINHRVAGEIEELPPVPARCVQRIQTRTDRCRCGCQLVRWEVRLHERADQERRDQQEEGAGQYQDENRRPVQSSTMYGYHGSRGGTKFSLTARALVQRIRFSRLPALSFVPLARPPPNGCCPTTAPVGLSFT